MKECPWHNKDKFWGPQHSTRKLKIAVIGKVKKSELQNAILILQSPLSKTAEKLGVHPAIVARQIQTAKNLTTEAKGIIRDTGTKIAKKNTLKLSRLEPELRRDAASQLAAGEIKSMGEYRPAPAEPEGLLSPERPRTSRCPLLPWAIIITPV